MTTAPTVNEDGGPGLPTGVTQQPYTAGLHYQWNQPAIRKQPAMSSLKNDLQSGVVVHAYGWFVTSLLFPVCVPALEFHLSESKIFILRTFSVH